MATLHLVPFEYLPESTTVPPGGWGFDKAALRQGDVGGIGYNTTFTTAMRGREHLPKGVEDGGAVSLHLLQNQGRIKQTHPPSLPQTNPLPPPHGIDWPIDKWPWGVHEGWWLYGLLLLIEAVGGSVCWGGGGGNSGQLSEGVGGTFGRLNRFNTATSKS